MIHSRSLSTLFAGLAMLTGIVACQPPQSHSQDADQVILQEMEQALSRDLLDHWFPAIVDADSGGYYSNLSHDWQLLPQQEKMIVTQARHMWTSAKAAAFYPEVPHYRTASDHGLPFLQRAMWDSVHGGFFSLVSRTGQFLPGADFLGEKTAYGNAFAIYGLAAHHALTGSPESLELAQKTFHWLETHAYDPVHKGYFQNLTQEGKVFGRDLEASADAPITKRLGLKDQNSSIHLLEAFTELYQVWPDSVLGERLGEMLYLIREVITQEPGYLQLFLSAEWEPFSFQDSTEEVRKQYYGYDHVSFGHDVETAFLMLEASEVLGKKDYDRTLEIGKRMVDHSLAYGFDHEKGGFLEQGYYYTGEAQLRIIDERKNWWAQAEGLNALLLFSQLYPEEPQYKTAFYKQWNYIQEYLMDAENGGWYSFGIDESPQAQTGRKGNIWKSAYHNGRALMHCINMLKAGH